MGRIHSKPLLGQRAWVTAGMTNEARIKEGEKFLSVIWAEVAEQVVETAVKVYGLTPEQAGALRQAFLRGATFGVEAEL